MNRSLKLELAQHQLLAIELLRPGQVRALSGRHWLSVDGLDIDLAPGEQADVPAGSILAEGNGMLEFSQMPEQGAGKWPLSRPAQSTMLVGKVCF
jgi:hypothetical protein